MMMTQLEMENLTLGLSAPDELIGYEDEVERVLLQDFDLFQQNASLRSGGEGGPVGSLRESCVDLGRQVSQSDDLFSAKPSDITGQSLAFKMKDDKEEVLQQLKIEKAPATPQSPMMVDWGIEFSNLGSSELQPLFEAQQEMMREQQLRPLVQAQQELMKDDFGLTTTDENIAENQNLIDEMAEFLDQYQGNLDPSGEAECDALAAQMLTLEQQQSLKAIGDECPLANSTLTEEETAAAEDILDKLLKDHDISNDVSTSFEYPSRSNNNTKTEALAAKELKEEPYIYNHEGPLSDLKLTDSPIETKGNETTSFFVDQQQLEDSGFGGSFLNVSNISQVIAEDGSNVIIVVTESPRMMEEARSVQAGGIPTPAAAAATDKRADLLSSIPCSEILGITEPETDNVSVVSMESDDSEWLPDPVKLSTSGRLTTTTTTAKKKPGRKLQERKPIVLGKVQKKSTTIRDKKERKKLQNVEAARRYRDKKKEQENLILNEEQQELERNQRLKSVLFDKEAELKTLKKLMAEFGILNSSLV